MTVKDFVDSLRNGNAVDFADVMAVVDAHYDFSPTAFTNGELSNAAGENNGSCKVFAFGLLHGLSQEQTLACFGDYYRKDVLQNPEGDDHQNIRNFMVTGWGGITFSSAAIVAK